MTGIIHRAQAKRDGTGFVIQFDDGRATQGQDRADALMMAADLRATVDERDPSAYWARWVGKDEIWVLALAPSVHEEVQHLANSRQVGVAARRIFGADRATFEALADA